MPSPKSKPVYFASRALSETQKGYVAIELESLAVTWVMEKFHHFLYGNKFVLETDQKPLEAILLRSLNQATPGLQCILIRTFPYHFKDRYIPGLANHEADCLSRQGFQKDTISLLKLHVNQITSQLKARSNSLHNLQLATKDDDKHAILKHIIQQVWPKTIKEVPSKIQPYWTFCKELTIEDGLVLKGIRIIKPDKKREETLEESGYRHISF